MSELLGATLTEIAEKIRTREVTSEEVTRCCLKRIEETADRNIFISVYERESLAQARACDLLTEAGISLGPLHGVPIALKDNINMKGLRTTAGSKILRDNIPKEDATVAARLRSAGAVIIGKTNMHEFAWGGTTENPHYGCCANAWDKTRNPAGSSGGSGSAVALGCCYGALGTDTGGSVRLPSAVNGITGIRPSIGRISNYGVIPLAYSEDTVGPICRSVEDCAVMFGVLAGHDYRDKTTALVAAQDYTAELHKGVRDIRLGIIKDYSMLHNQPDVQKCYEEALEQFRSLGAIIKEIELPDIDTLIDAQLIIDAVEPSAVHLDLLRKRPEEYGEDVRILLEAGCMFTGTQYLQALSYRSIFKAEVEEALREVDAIVTPTLPFTALKIGQHEIEIIPGQIEDGLSGNMRYTAIASVSGKPALSIPIGFDAQGLPVGMQILGEAFEEALLFRIGNAYQQSTGYAKRTPVLG